jgi:hypothetical protein
MTRPLGLARASLPELMQATIPGGFTIATKALRHLDGRSGLECRGRSEPNCLCAVAGASLPAGSCATLFWVVLVFGY